MEAAERGARVAPKRARAGLMSRCTELVVHRYLAGLERGAISLNSPGSADVSFGDPAAELRASLSVHDRRFFWRIIAGGDLGFAESFMDGDWSTDDLTTLLRIFAEEDPGVATAVPRRILARAYHLSRRNTLAGNRRNIQDHYDLGNEFFSLFLDPSMTYSSGIFPSGEESLGEAQRLKIDTIIDKAQIGGDHHVLEIGSGWGSFAIEVARRTGCRVTTVTLSDEQYRHVQRLAAESGLQDLVEVQLRDYRDLEGRFDRIVSIEMLEAVGHENLATYFQVCDRLLAPGGRAVIQVITIRDELYEGYRRGCDFIQRHIFPGGHLPCWRALAESIASAPGLRIDNVENIGHHYARTLAEWRSRFAAKADEIRALGFDDAFIRKWEYYFSYCEAGFLSRMLGNLHLVLSKPTE